MIFCAVIGFTLGTIFGAALMCLVQINRHTGG